MENPRFVFGVDPGKTGAISIFSYVFDDYYLQDIVDYENTDVIIRMLQVITQNIYPSKNMCVTFIENVHAAPGQSVSAMFNFGQNLGWWKGLFDGFGIEYKLIAPQSWSPKMLGRTDDKKNKAREVATQLFSRDLDSKVDPNGHSWFHLKKNDGRADAALIGWYGINKYILHT